MKIIFDDPTEKSSFTIVPTDDRKLIRQFIDYETGYLIVEELEETDSSSEVLCIIIDPQTGEIIDTNTRLKQIDAEEKVSFDKETGFKIVTQRVINPDTGRESIHEKLIDISTGKELSSSKSVAFWPERRKTILEHYQESREREAKAQQFWREEYPEMSYEERRVFWLLRINRQMRWQAEAGFDMYAIFDKEVYRDWKEKEPEIDAILNYVAENIPLRDEDREELRQKIDQIRGG